MWFNNTLLALLVLHLICGHIVWYHFSGISILLRVMSASSVKVYMTEFFLISLLFPRVLDIKCQISLLVEYKTVLDGRLRIVGL